MVDPDSDFKHSLMTKNKNIFTDIDENEIVTPNNVVTHLASKISRRNSLLVKLNRRPSLKKLVDVNIIHEMDPVDILNLKIKISRQLNQRLKSRPSIDEVQNTGILKNSAANDTNNIDSLEEKILNRSTISSLYEKKILRFNQYVEVVSSQQYDRRGDKPWMTLSPKDKAAIRKELNEFKELEMDIHENSRHLTRFHKP